MIQSPAGYQGDVRVKRYLDFYQAGYGVAMLSSGVAFSPLSLFANGEQGGWYDPSDLTTLFQDAAGTTPVTAVEQPVGLVLDKSKGLVLGSEIVTNGDFSNGTTGWAGNSSYTVTGGALVFTNGAYGEIYQTPGAAITNKYLKVSFNLTITSGTVTFRPNYFSTAGQQAFTTSGLKEFYVYGDGTRFAFITSATPSGASIDNVSIKAVQGNHLSQSTSTARPVLSARVNLLTRTEEFDNAAWAKDSLLAFGSGSIVNATTAPNGTITADLITSANATTSTGVSQTGIVMAAASYTWSVCFKPNGVRYVQLLWGGGGSSNYANFDLVSGTVTAGIYSSATIFQEANGFYRISITSTVIAGTYGVYAWFVDTGSAGRGANFTGDGVKGAYIWGADLRPSNAGVGLPSYQRVTTSTDYDTTGFPLYLKFDGTDDLLMPGTINPGSVDKAQIFAGVRKLSDAASAILAEYGTDAANVNGSLALFAPAGSGSNKFQFTERGSIAIPAFTTSTSYNAPTTNVISGIGDISGDTATLRINGAQIVQETGDQGTGNFAALSLYVGSRAGTSLRLNGHLYSLILRFSATNMDAATIASTETWVNGKTGAY